MPTRMNADAWKQYHAITAGRPVREHLRRAVDFVDTEGSPRLAVDLGFGAGVEALHLLRNGYRVFAVDAARSAVRTLQSSMPIRLQGKATLQVERLERAQLPPADLVWAGLSLPFVSPNRFPALWSRIVAALEPGAVFAGDFFGPNHTWAGKSAKFCPSLPEVRRFMRPLELLSVTIERGARYSARRELIHSEMFTVIARKRKRTGRAA